MSRFGGAAPRRFATALATRPVAELAFVAGLGAVQTLAFVATAFWIVQFAAVALLAWRVGLASPRRAAVLGLVFGTAWLGAGTWWLFISL
ncbi:MAG: hypothetical protein ABI281_13705, partial [Caldimonas sp.]